MVVVQEDYHSKVSASNFPHSVLRAVLDFVVLYPNTRGWGSCCSSYLVLLMWFRGFGKILKMHVKLPGEGKKRNLMHSERTARFSESHSTHILQLRHLASVCLRFSSFCWTVVEKSTMLLVCPTPAETGPAQSDNNMWAHAKLHGFVTCQAAYWVCRWACSAQKRL